MWTSACDILSGLGMTIACILVIKAFRNWKDCVIGPWALYAWFAFDEKYTQKKNIILKNYIYIFKSEVVTVFLNEFLKYFIFKN